MGYQETLDKYLSTLNGNQYTSNTSPVQTANLAWDMSSLDYSAPGIEGWGNRLKGLTGIVNPLAWADTIAGVVKNNSIKKPDSDFFESAWDNFLGVTGGMVGGTFQGLSLPLPVAKATLLSIGSGLDELTDAINGKSDSDDLMQKLNKSWDLSLIDSWDTANNEAKGNIGLGEAGLFILGDLASVFLGKSSKEELRSIGAEWIDTDFDIFDPSQKEKLTGTALGLLVQPVNFVGEWMLDLTTFIPGGVLAKGVRYGVKGIAGSKLDFVRLQKAAGGESTAYSSTLSFFAENTDQQLIFNTLTSLGVNDKKVGILSKFLKDAKTEQEVADVFLAVEYKDAKALQRLTGRILPEEKYWTLPLDSSINGGTYGRRILDPKILEKEFLSDDDFNKEFILAIDSLIDYTKQLGDEAIDAYRSAEDLKFVTTDTVKNAAGIDEVVMTAAPLREYGLKTTAVGRAGLKFKSTLLEEDGFWKKLQYESSIPGFPTVVRIIRKAGLASHKGYIDLNNRQVAIEKMMSKLNDINDIAKGELVKKGELQRYVDGLMNARSNEEFVVAVDNIEKLGLRTVAAKSNMSSKNLDAILENMMNTYKLSQDSVQKMLNFDRKIHSPKDNIVYVSEGKPDVIDIVKTSEADITPNSYFGIDFTRLDREARTFGSNWETLYNTAMHTKDLLGRGVGLWTKFILARPARVPRERLANLPGLILSGNVYDIFLSENGREAFYNAFRNVPKRARRMVDDVKLKNELTGSYAGSLKKQLQNDRLFLENTNSTIRKAENIFSETARAHNAEVGSGNFSSPREAQAHFKTKAQSNAKTHYTDETIDDATGARVYNSAIEARRTRGSDKPVTISTWKNAEVAEAVKERSRIDYKINKVKETLAKKIAKDSTIPDPTFRNARINKAKEDARLELDALQAKRNTLDTIDNSKGHPDLDIIEQDLLENGGALYKYNSVGKATKVNISDLREKSPASLAKMNLAIRYTEPAKKATKGTTYGRELDLDNVDNLDELEEIARKAKFNSAEELIQHYKSGRQSVNQCGRGASIMDALAFAGFGVVRYLDEAGVAVEKVNPRLNTSSNPKALDVATEAEVRAWQKTPREEKAKIDNAGLRNKKDISEADIAAAETLTRIERAAASVENADGYSAFLDKYTPDLERLRTQRDALQQRVNKSERIIGRKPEEGLAPRVGTGKKTYRDQEYENYREGMDGRYAEAMIHPADSFRQIHDMNRVANAVYDNAGAAQIADLLPGDKDYFEGWASWLQLYGRNDSVFTMLASGKSTDEVLDWLKNTSAGKDYARSRNLGKNADNAARLKDVKSADEVGYAQTYEDYIEDRLDVIKKQLNTDEVKDLFNSGEDLTGEKLAEIFAGKEDLLMPLDGRIFKPGQQQKNIYSATRLLDKANKVFVENLQQTLENVPLATAFYNERMQKLIDLNIEKMGRDLSVAEINSLQRQARKDSERHVRKWIYNVQKKSNISEALSLFIPFISAYSFTIKSFIKGIQDNPAAALWLLTGINKVSQNANWIDAEGNPTDMFNASSLVIPVSEPIRNIMKGTFLGAYLGDSEEIRLSARSLNVWFGGEVVPGPGPLVTLPVSELVKGNPDVAIAINNITKKYLPLIPGGEGLIDYLLPMGPSTKPGSLDQLLPTWLNGVIDAGLFTQFTNPEWRGQQYVDAYAKIMAHESAKARMLGPNAPMPTAQEIEEKVDALYALKFLSAFVGPVAYQVKSEADLARQTYKQYKDKFGEDADWQFITDHPELISGMVTTTRNDFGLSPDAQTIYNLENNPEVIDEFLDAGNAGKDMMGFFMNSSNNPEFDELAYSALQNGTPGIGAGTYYDKLSPEEVGRKAAAKAGWVYFNALMGAIDAEAIERDVDPETDVKLSSAKKKTLDLLKTNYPEWASEYMQRDAYKYADRAETIEDLLDSKAFMGNLGQQDWIPALAVFIDSRNSILEALQTRREKGGSGSITTETNTDLRMAYNKVIYQLKSESLRFSDFYNRFFDGDSLTL
jgi:hypothetical protein